MADTPFQDAAITPVTLGDLIEKATPHEEWLAPLDPRLCDGLAIASLGMLIGALLPGVLFAGSASFWGVAFVAFLCNVTGLILLGVLGWKTNWFKAGPLVWHRVGAGLVGLGATDLAIVSIPVLAAAAYFLFWVVVIGLVVVVVVFVLLGALFLR